METEDCQPEVPRGAVFLQAHADLGFLLTEQTRQLKDLPGREKRHANWIHTSTDSGETQMENPWT
jgi:hypothetical protein